MSPFFCMVWPGAAFELAARAEQILQSLSRSEEWCIADQSDGCAVLVRDTRPLTIRRLDLRGSIVLGDLFEASGGPAPSILSMGEVQDPRRNLAALLGRYWGRYVAVCRETLTGFTGALRDPCGAGDTMVWSRDGFTLVASEIPNAAQGPLGPCWGLDWNAIHAQAADPIFAGSAAPLAGTSLIPPGAAVWPIGRGFRIDPLWTPAKILKPTIGDARDARALIRRKVETSIAAFAGQPGSILAEVSGGFDSSVVATTLRKVGAPVTVWCNHFTDDPSGDERSYARALARYLSIEVLERPRPHFVLDPEWIEAGQFGPRPSAFALDSAYELETLEVAKASGARRLFTGFGGDGLFFVSDFPEIAHDLFRRKGIGAFADPAMRSLARWCRKSIWTVARRALFPGKITSEVPIPTWVAPRSQTEKTHPWLQDLEGLSPAKRFHVGEQVLASLAGGVSPRARMLDLVHPLMSQPILETCLKIPVDLLVEGGRDRALARQAFDERLPPEVLHRRSKGELGLYYSRAVSGGLSAIRPYLMEGRLADKGIVDRTELDEILTEAKFAERGGFATLLFTVAIEGWVRHWESRLFSAVA